MHVKSSVVAAIAVTIGMAMATSTRAESWYLMVVNRDHLIAVDRDTVRWRDKHVLILVTAIQPIPTAAPMNTFYQSLSETQEFDCESRRFRVVSSTLNATDGHVVYADPNVEPWKDYPAKSVDDGIANLGCRNVVNEANDRYDTFSAMQNAYLGAISTYLSTHQKP